jgi:hypothetical protein
MWTGSADQRAASNQRRLRDERELVAPGHDGAAGTDIASGAQDPVAIAAYTTCGADGERGTPRQGRDPRSAAILTLGSANSSQARRRAGVRGARRRSVESSASRAHRGGRSSSRCTADRAPVLGDIAAEFVNCIAVPGCAAEQNGIVANANTWHSMGRRRRRPEQ